MSRETSSQFVYVSYIRTTQEKLWRALITPEFMDQYWLGAQFRADWKVGGAWKIVLNDGRLADTGEVLEFEPTRRIVLKWRNEFRPELKEEGFSRCVMDIEPEGTLVKLTITHSIERENSKLVVAVSGGWPKILSSLKTFLETGEPLPPTAAKCCRSDICNPGRAQRDPGPIGTCCNGSRIVSLREPSGMTLYFHF